MPRGPKPKPTADKIARGNPGQRRLNANEPKPNGKARMPRWLGEGGKKEWKRLAPELEKIGILTMADQSSFATYCQSVGDYVDAVTAMRNQPLMVTGTGGGSKNHPGWMVLNAAADRVIKYGAEFGLTPSARSRISVAKAARVEDLDDFVDSKPNLKLKHG